MSDDLTIDFTDVQASSFDALPQGWYFVTVTDAQDVETKNAGKLPAGTPGTNWEFTIEEGEYENRRLWTNHWHHPSTLGFMKTMLLACGAYTEEEMAEGALKVDDARDRAEGKSVWVKVSVRKTEQYGDQNDIKTFKSADNPPKQGSGGGSKSFMP